MTQMPKAQISAYYHRRIGDIVVTAVSDGYLDGTVEVLRGIDPDEAPGILSAAFRPVPGRRTSVNCFLVRTGGRLALIDRKSTRLNSSHYYAYRMPSST